MSKFDEDAISLVLASLKLDHTDKYIRRGLKARLLSEGISDPKDYERAARRWATEILRRMRLEFLTDIGEENNINELLKTGLVDPFRDNDNPANPSEFGRGLSKSHDALLDAAKAIKSGGMTTAKQIRERDEAKKDEARKGLKR